MPRGQRITVYFGESDRWQHQSLAMALLELLRREGCSGATLTRGVAGFGAGSRIKTSAVLRLSFDLPLVLTVVDTPPRVARLLPKIGEMVGGGLITVEEVEIYQYSSPFKDALPELPVREAMTTAVVSVSPDTPLAAALELLLQHPFTALPVVDAQRRVVGMLREADLVQAEAVRAAPERTPVAAVMQREVLTTTPETSIREVAHRMLHSDVRQLPVVDAAGTLQGIISRIDLLRVVGAGYLPQEGPQPAAVPTGGPEVPVAHLMQQPAPTVPLTASLAEVVHTILGSAARCALVVDAEGCLRGIVTPSDLVWRLDPQAHPGLWQTLRSHLPLLGHRAARQAVRKATAKQAEEVMSAPVVTVAPQTPVRTALLLATQQGLKRLPVVDAQQRPLGLVSRKELLRAVLRGAGE
ncbi:MAG: hypothetical protein KatS3mg131_3906 [Candidatus Tectimicrobiota bacterium]|nr:MAG: hypothetical protein KatS3mg131_3906 [Candidatus Tectomicrobia bacterium]